MNWSKKMALGCVVFAVGCASNDPLPDPNNGVTGERPKTVVMTEFAGDTLLDYSDIGTLTIDTTVSPPIRSQGELGTMKVDEVQEVKVGTIIVSAPTKKLPYGLLRKVKSVKKNQDGTANMETIQANLAEAIAGSDLKKEDIGAVQTARIPVYQVRNGVDTDNLPRVLSNQTSDKLNPQAEFDIINLKEKCFDPSIGKGPTKIVASNCVSIRAWLDVKIDIGWGWWGFIPYPYLAGFGATLNAASNIKLTQSIQAQVSPQLDPIWYTPDEKQRYNPDLQFYDYGMWAPPAVVWLGPLPVVIVPAFNFKGGLYDTNLVLAANANIALTSNFTTMNIDVGTAGNPFQYGFYCGNTSNAAGNNWGCKEVSTLNYWVNQISTWSNQWDAKNPLTLSAAIGASATLSTRIVPMGATGGLYLFGVLGATAGVQPYLKPTLSLATSFPLNVPASFNNLTTTFTGTAGFGVKGNVNLQLSVLGMPLYTSSSLINKDIYRSRDAEIFNFCWRGTTRVDKTQCSP